ncbi:4'-phosphopantetheinyl transferase superfamily protein [Rapidithrix thailandica]|uniref:4'-phosphopantetheinyl transferase superfamily protein n=1 Tax=Rapidithrix thailandica TaxID=413964 RepID=A0AAW9RU61_9BACT
MPLINIRQIHKHLHWGIWEITEEEHVLSEWLDNTCDLTEVGQIRNVLKRKQSLAGKAVVKALMEYKQLPFAGMDKDACGKPFLKNSNFHISVSHSDTYALGILHEQKPVGIDIEKVTPRIFRVVDKFLSSEEKAQLSMEDAHELTRCWCAKEALYKFFGKKQLSLKEDIFLDLASSEGTIKKGEHIHHVPLHFLRQDQYMIALTS